MAARNITAGRRFPNSGPGANTKPPRRTGSASSWPFGAGRNQKTAGRKEMTPRSLSTSLNPSRQAADYASSPPAPFKNAQPSSYPSVPKTLSSGDSNSTGYVGKGSNRISQDEPQSRVMSQSQMNAASGHANMNPLGRTTPLTSGFPTSGVTRRSGNNRNVPVSNGLPQLTAAQKKAYPSLRGGYRP
jgi:hypothetical protein